MRSTARASGRLSEDVQAVLFRSVRELLMNVVKHARTQRVDITIENNDHYLIIRVSDDGRGFIVDQVGHSHHAYGFGLLSIRESLERFGGRLDLEAAPGQGCCATIVTPVG